MLRTLCGRLRNQAIKPAALDRLNIQAALVASFKFKFTAFDIDRGAPVEVEEEPDPRFAKNSFRHHGQRPRYKTPKFVSPKKRANKLYELLQNEAIAKAKAETPKVWEENFRVGDAVELEIVLQGGVDTTNPRDKEKIRGVIIGIFKKRIDHSILIRDVISGSPVERKIPLHSPLVRSLTILQRDYAYRGTNMKRRKSKLYYLSDLNPSSKLRSLFPVFQCICQSQLCMS